MMGNSPWMRGSLLGMMLLMGGGAMAQTQPRYDAPPVGTGQGDDDAYHDEDLARPDQDSQARPSGRTRAEDDFSDVLGAEQDRQPPLPTDDGDRARPPLAGNDENDALTNDCAIAAREEAERNGGYAEIRQMESPRETRSGFSIDGDVERRSSWRAQDGRLRHFTCTVVNGRIQEVYFRRDRADR
ncbi:hypothetical protein [Sphingobium mellinum]|uniref:hypothetical protein n=1 Tax=Sphingobium mellinum TaxID=1387166 RepID=UPI0030EEEF18